MKISSRIEISLTCGNNEYYDNGGVDYQTALPTLLKALKKLVEQHFYCGDKQHPTLYFFVPGFLYNTNTNSGFNILQPSGGGWEFPYVAIPVEYREHGYFPATDMEDILKPELLKLFDQWGVDPRAYTCEIRQWNLDVEPDDTAEIEF